MVHLMSFNVDCAERTCRTQVLASSAAYATLGVHSRYLRRIGIGAVRRHHRYSTHRTVTGAVATLYAIGQWYAVLLYPHSMAYLYCRLVGSCDRLDGSGRTHLATLGTLRATIAQFV